MGARISSRLALAPPSAVWTDSLLLQVLCVWRAWTPRITATRRHVHRHTARHTARHERHRQPPTTCIGRLRPPRA